MVEKSPDIIRQGVVSSINYETGRVRVVYGDKNNNVTQELPLLTFEYDMPKVGEHVYVAHQSNGIEDGVVLCRYWRENELPEEYGAHIWRKELRDDNGSFLKFDRNTHTLTINVAGSTDVSVSIDAAKDVSVKTSGNVTIQAAESLKIITVKDIDIQTEANINLTAKKIFIDGEIETANDIKTKGKVKAIEGEIGQPGQEIMLTRHKHKGVSVGSSVSGTPEAPTN